MKKLGLLLIAILAISMMAMIAAPALAKPGVVTVTITVKDPSGNRLSNFYVYAQVPGEPYKLTDAVLTNNRGKVTLAIPIEWFGTVPLNVNVYGTWQAAVVYLSGTIDYTGKGTIRMTVTYSGPLTQP